MHSVGLGTVDFLVVILPQQWGTVHFSVLYFPWLRELQSKNWKKNIVFNFQSHLENYFCLQIYTYVFFVQDESKAYVII